jgi:hypothetical protein
MGWHLVGGGQRRQAALHVKLEARVLLVLGDAQQNVACPQRRVQRELVDLLVVARGRREFLAYLIRYINVLENHFPPFPTIG